MQRWFATSTRVVLGLFAIGILGAIAYQWYYVWPVERCDRRGDWWDARDRQCLAPIPVWRITGHVQTPPSGPSPDQRVAPGVHSTSPAPRALANLAATNRRSERRLR